ncbi:MAG: hypothetical protein KF729_25685 [Sandaracinaceae bacterium]|nr:hypothetical protein [Sandaracinaceae bacterium]
MSRRALGSLCASLALVAASALAQAPALPTRSTFTSQAHYNLHRAPLGAQGAGHEGRVELRGDARGRVTVTDEGESREYDLSASGRHEETVVRWRHVWTGRITRAGDTLAVRLRVSTSSCARELRVDGASGTPTPCDGQAGRTLRCTRDGAARGWRCADVAPRPAAGTPTPWALVEGEGCVARSGGDPMTGPPTYTPCDDDP